MHDEDLLKRSLASVLHPCTQMKQLETLTLLRLHALPGCGEFVAGQPVSRAALLAVEGEDGREYWLGFDKFYAITRYNRSLHYALAVYRFSREIRSARRMGH